MTTAIRTVEIFLEIASTDWYKSMWTVLDLQENGIYKLVSKRREPE